MRTTAFHQVNHIATQVRQEMGGMRDAVLEALTAVTEEKVEHDRALKQAVVKQYNELFDRIR